MITNPYRRALAFDAVISHDALRRASIRSMIANDAPDFWLCGNARTLGADRTSPGRAVARNLVTRPATMAGLEVFLANTLDWCVVSAPYWHHFIATATTFDRNNLIAPLIGHRLLSRCETSRNRTLTCDSRLVDHRPCRIDETTRISRWTSPGTKPCLGCLRCGLRREWGLEFTAQLADIAQSAKPHAQCDRTEEIGRDGRAYDIVIICGRDTILDVAADLPGIPLCRSTQVPGVLDCTLPNTFQASADLLYVPLCCSTKVPGVLDHALTNFFGSACYVVEAKGLGRACIRNYSNGNQARSDAHSDSGAKHSSANASVFTVALTCIYAPVGRGHGGLPGGILF